MTATLDDLEDVILPVVSKPGQYLSPFGEETGSRFETASCRVCVLTSRSLADAFADPGTTSFLHALLDAAGLEPGDPLVDLATAPGPDMVEELASRGLPPFGLATRRPLSEFDLIVLLVESPLDLPDALDLLSRAGIPLRAGDRGRESPGVILAGGIALTPEPGSTFADALLVGDPEAFAADLLGWASRRRKGDEVFTAGSPAGRGIHRGRVPEAVEPRWLPRLPAIPARPMVPKGVHLPDGLPVELSRPAGPSGLARRRPVEELLPQVEAAMAATGFGDLTLVVGRGAPYPELVKVLELLNQCLGPHGVSVRIREAPAAGFDPSLARELRKGGRSQLTLAPVAPSARLRAGAGAPLEREELLDAVRIAGRGGWSALRLQVVLGSPGETEADLAEWEETLEAARNLRFAPGAPPRISVLALPFVPAPGEWTVTADRYRETVSGWRERLSRRRIKVSARPPEAAWVETALRVPGSAGVVEGAVAAGLRRQTNPEAFQAAPWEALFREAGSEWPPRVSPEPVPRFRTVPVPEPEADSVDPVYERREGDEAADLRFGSPPWQGGRRPRRMGKGRSVRQADRFRVRFSKSDPLRFTAHLDVTRAFDRAFRKTQLPVAVSQGKDRKPKLSFGPPLPLGMTSGAEYFDLTFSREVPEHFREALNRALPEGLAVVAAAPMRTEPASLNSAIQIAEYEVTFTDALIHNHLSGMDFDSLKELLEGAAAEASAADVLEMTKVRGETSRTFNARPSLLEARVVRDDGGRPVLGLRLTLNAPDSVRPETLTAYLCRPAHFDERLLRVHRSGLFIPGRRKDHDPLDVVRPDFAWWRNPVRGGAAR